MMSLNNLFAENLDSLLIELKPYQREIISSLLSSSNQDLERAAEKWLTMTGSSQIIAFGGIDSSKPFWESFKNELHRFLCDDNAYRDFKKAFGDENHITRAVAINSISAGIGAYLGYPATLLVPAVLLMLKLIMKMGINAYCNKNK